MGKTSTWAQIGLAFAFLAFALPVAAQVTAQRTRSEVVVYTNDNAPNGPVTNAGHGFPFHQYPIRSRLEPLVRGLAERRHLDPRLVEAVISVESGWNPRAVSPKGAAGLMQLMPATASQLGVQDVFDPTGNVRAGVTYLENLLHRSGGDLRKALAAYYAGQGAVERAGGVPESPVIRQYVSHVLDVYFRAGSPGEAPETAPSVIYETVDPRGRKVFTNQ